MVRLSLKNGLTGEEISALVLQFNQQQRRFKRLERYYDNRNNILYRHMEAPKPNNKICHSFCKYITNMATGYFMGRGVRFIIEDPAYKENFDQVMNEEYTRDISFEIAKEASKCGIAFELLYVNEKSRLRSKMFTAKEFIPIYSNKIDEFLEGAVRLWTETDFRDKRKKILWAELYTDKEIITYRNHDSSGFRETERHPHYFGDVPVIIYRNNIEEKGDFEDVISLVDAYDKAQSDSANDFEYFTDAYLAIIGAGDGFINDYDQVDDGGGHNRIKTLREDRVLLLDEKGQAQWLIKNVNDTAVENYKDRIRKDLFFLAQVPALSDESFGQNLSGVAIRYKLIGLEELSVIKENKFRASLKKKIKLVTQYLNTFNHKDFDPNGVQIQFDRNFIDNTTEWIEAAGKLEGVTSKESQLKVLPFIDDPKSEIETILREQQQFEDSRKIDDDELTWLKGLGKEDA